MKLSDENLKIVLYLVFAIVVFFMVKYTVKSFKSGISDIFGDSPEEKQEKAEEKSREQSKVLNAKKQAEILSRKEFPKYKNQTMLDLADKLYKSKKGWYEPNDVKAFNYVINSMDSDLDFQRLIQFFGVRDGLSLKPWIAKNYDADYFNKWMLQHKPKVKFFV